MVKKVGIALGAGGAKGFAHIGVLQVLQREGIAIEMISGTSMGAVVGAAYAAGSDLEFMGKLAANINHSMIMDMNLPRVGLLKGQRALDIIRLLTHNKSFDQLDIPFAAVATDIQKGEPVVFRDGDVAQAVRASISIPGIFNPVRIDNRILVDGAVTERLPVGILKEMGADIIIGVDVKLKSQDKKDKVKIGNIYDIIIQSIEILETRACRPSIELADCIITPDTSAITTTDFGKGRECVEIGRLAAEEKIGEIKELLGLE